MLQRIIDNFQDTVELVEESKFIVIDYAEIYVRDKVIIYNKIDNGR